MSLCKYKNMFGEPNTGLHSIRIFDIAIIDVLSTLLLGIVIHQLIFLNLLKMGETVKLWMVVFVCFIIGILSHRLFCVRTTIDKLLFKNN